MRTCLLLILWIALWICLSLRHVAPPVTPRTAVSPSSGWPCAPLWQLLLDRRPASFAVYGGGDELDGPHHNWTPERLAKHPSLLLHVEDCGREKVFTLEQLATGRIRFADTIRYHEHPLAHLPADSPELAAYEKLLPRLEAAHREALLRALNRIDPARLQQLLVQFERPDNRDWWLDAEALTRLGSRRGLEKILASPNSEVRSLGPVLAWLRAPQDTRLWREAMQVALRDAPGQKWASACLLRSGPERLRIRALRELMRNNPFLSAAPAAGLEEWAWRQVEQGSASAEVQKVVQSTLTGGWSPRRVRLAQGLVLDKRWPSDLRKSIAGVLLRDNPAHLRTSWLERWPELWGELPVGYGDGPAYRQALAELDRSECFDGNLPERLWRAGRLTPARVKQAMRSGSDLSQAEIKLSVTLRQTMPSGLLAQMLETDGDDEWIEQIWPPSFKQDSIIDQAALARLGRGQFRDYFTLELLFRQEARFDPKSLAAIREQGGGPGGVASALLGKVELEGGDPHFLACHLMAHLYLKHDNLPLVRVFELQEGAPARLFQAAQAYLEASSDPLAAQLLKRRGGRVLLIEGQALCRWMGWLPALRREALERQAPILVWSDHEDVRSEVRGRELRVVRGAETRIRQLSEQELALLQQLQRPAPVQPSSGGYFSHYQTVVWLAPQGGWALNLADLPPGHPGRIWDKTLWEISRKPGGTVVWSFAPDFPLVETLAYHPNESFEGIRLSHGRPVLKTWQGWCDLQLRPCSAPRGPSTLGWLAADETHGVITPATENTRLERKTQPAWSYLFHGLKFENFCVEGRELYLESRGRVVHVTLPPTAGR